METEIINKIYLIEINDEEVVLTDEENCLCSCTDDLSFLQSNVELVEIFKAIKDNKRLFIDKRNKDV